MYIYLCFTSPTVLFVSVNQVQPTAQCSFCIFIVKTLEDLLPKERTEVHHTHQEKKLAHEETQHLFVLHTDI